MQNDQSPPGALALIQTFAHKAGLCSRDVVLDDTELVALFEQFVTRLPAKPGDVQAFISQLIDGVIWNDIVIRVVEGIRDNPTFREEFLRLVRGV